MTALQNKTSKDVPATKGALRALVRPHWARITVLALVSLVAALLEAAFIVLLTGIGMALVTSSEVVGPVLGATAPMSLALGAAASALLLKTALSIYGVQLSAALTAVVTTEQRQRLASAFLRTTWDNQQKEPAGRLQELLTSFVTRISNTVSVFANALISGLSLAAFLLVAVIMDPLATGALIIALIIVGSLLTPLRRAIRRRSMSNRAAGLAFSNAVAELGSLGLEMQAFGVERDFERRIGMWTLESTETQRRTQSLQGMMPHAYMSVAYAAVLAGIAALTLVGAPDLGALGAVLLLMLRSLSYGQQLSTASANLSASLPFVEGVAEMITGYEAAPAHQGAATPRSVLPLKAERIAFEYEAGRTALADVAFELDSGGTLGIIGPSGAGKSTLAQLLLDLRTPTEGTLTASGINLPEIDRNWWTSRVAFVPQDAKLITGTVADNIRFFREGLSDHDLRVAAAQANVLDDIDALPGGFDTHLGELGGQLSGGQKQRLSIARALVAKPELLILDEPTSALDGASEALIRTTLMNLRDQFAIIIIAHRMSTLDICDRIMVIEGGQMTALATPEELCESSEFYKNALSIAGMRNKIVN